MCLLVGNLLSLCHTRLVQLIHHLCHQQTVLHELYGMSSGAPRVQMTHIHPSITHIMRTLQGFISRVAGHSRQKCCAFHRRKIGHSLPARLYNVRYLEDFTR